MWSYLCYNDYLDVVRVWTLSVGWGDASLDCLNPRLPQLLRLSLKHTAPAERSQQYYDISMCPHHYPRWHCNTNKMQKQKFWFYVLDLRYIFVYIVSFYLRGEVKQKRSSAIVENTTKISTAESDGKCQ